MVDPMSGYAMEWAIEVAEAKQLSPDATLVLCAVAYFASHKHGMAWCARDEIRAKTNFGHNRVKRAVAELEDARVVPMKRYPNRIVWGPFPVLPPRGGAAKLSTPPRGSGPPGVRSEPRKVGRIVAACDVYRTPVRPVTGPPGVREPLRSESQNLRADDCARCNGAGALLGDEDPRTGRARVVPCPVCRP